MTEQANHDFYKLCGNFQTHKIMPITSFAATLRYTLGNILEKVNHGKCDLDEANEPDYGFFNRYSIALISHDIANHAKPNSQLPTPAQNRQVS